MLRWTCVALLGFLLVFSGCGEPKRPPTIQAGGKVTYQGDGRPVSSVEIVLTPVAGGDYSPHGKLDQDGKFQLSTFGENDGAPAGMYKAHFRAALPELPQGPPPAVGKPKAAGMPPVIRIETIVPKEYLTPERTPLTSVEVREGGEISLQIPRPRTK